MSADLGALLRSDTPLIDLRSPGEFATGAIPGAINLPLLSDAERVQIGITYKQAGQAEAIVLGESLVSGALKSQRLAAWQAFASRHANTWTYCSRGGLRSETVQTWLAAAGLDVPRVPGGFKALRQTCLDILLQAPGVKPWLVVGGRTGSGKTQLLRRIGSSIDLEGLANHRGSAFGARDTEQPPPIGFENALAVAYLKHDRPILLLEDEGRIIGRLALPIHWFEEMQRAPLLILEVDLETRCANICDEYVTQALANGMTAEALRSRYLSALTRIRKRLGGLRTTEVTRILQQSFDCGEHRPWIARLLEWYYDPMYDYQLKKKRARVRAQGTAQKLTEVIAEFETSGKRC